MPAQRAENINREGKMVEISEGEGDGWAAGLQW